MKTASEFWYWVNERQRIFLAKERGDPKPWTKDSILQSYKFTNVFRQQDRVTRELTQRLGKSGSKKTIFFKICIFRMFNWPPTYDALFAEQMVSSWDTRKAKQITDTMIRNKEKVFTGAYIITNAGSTRPKNHIVCDSIHALWKARDSILARIQKSNTIEGAVGILSEYPSIGQFVGYELATDFSQTNVLPNPEDRYTWANPGPGARRGLNRIYRGDKKQKPSRNAFMNATESYIREIKFLLSLAPDQLDRKVFADGCAMEMRDIEHSLCEYDKYMRVKNNEGRPRSRYDGR